MKKKRKQHIHLIQILEDQDPHIRRVFHQFCHLSLVVEKSQDDDDHSDQRTTQDKSAGTTLDLFGSFGDRQDPNAFQLVCFTSIWEFFFLCRKVELIATKKWKVF